MVQGPVPVHRSFCNGPQWDSEKNALQSLVHKVGLVIEELSVQFLPQPSCGFLIEYQTLPKSLDAVKYKLLPLFHGRME